MDAADPFKNFQELSEAVDRFRSSCDHSTKRDPLLSVWDPLRRLDERSDGSDGSDDEGASESDVHPFRGIHNALRSYHRSAAVYTTGSISGDYSIASRGNYGGQGEESFGSLVHPDVEKLLSLAEVAPFGRGDQTVVDENVRKAKCVPTNKFSLGHSFSRHALNKITDHLQRALCIPESVVARNERLHIYEEGGHFVAHRDTLKDRNHLATLVILLGAQHTGGEFCIQGQECVMPGEGLPWVAFFTDVLHEIQPVTSGIRIALQFDIMKSTRSSDSHHGYTFTAFVQPSELRQNAPGDPALSTEVVNLVQNQRSDVILPLFHYYSQDQLHGGELKPVDAQLFEQLRQAGLTVHLVPLVLKESWRRHWHRYDECTDIWKLNAAIFWYPTRSNVITQVKQHTTLLLSDVLEGRKAWHDDEYTGNEAQSEELTYWFAGVYITFARG